MLARIPAFIYRLLQQSLYLCQESEISRTLDLCLNADLVSRILAKCDLGDYDIQWSQFTKIDETEHHNAGSLAGEFMNDAVTMRILRDYDVQGADRFACDIYNRHFHELGMVMSASIVMPIATRFAVSSFVFKKELVEIKATKHNEEFSKNEQTMGVFNELVEYLSANGGSQLALNAFASLRQCDESILPTHQNLITQLLSKTLLSRHIDHSIALGYMTSLSNREGFDSFSRALSPLFHEYERLAEVAQIGMDAALIWHQQTFYQECNMLHVNAQWWSRLSQLAVPFDYKLFRDSTCGPASLKRNSTAKSTYQRQLLPTLLEKSGFNMALTLDFAQTYGVEEEFVYHLSIEAWLLHPKASQDSNYQLKVQEVSKYLPPEELHTLLTHQVLPKLSPTDYERIRFVCSVIPAAYQDSRIQDYMHIIDILSTFTCTNITTPSVQPPTESSLTCQTGKGSLNDIFSSRLPFHQLLNDPWNILEKELNSITVKKLVALSHPLRLDPDEFYVCVLKRMVKWEESDIQIGVMCNSLRDSFFTMDISSAPKVCETSFSEIRPLIQNIRSHQTAVVTCALIAKSLPLCPQRVAVLRLGSALAKKWRDSIVQELECSSLSREEVVKYKSTGESESMTLSNSVCSTNTNSSSTVQTPQKLQQKQVALAATLAEELENERNRTILYLQLHSLTNDVEIFRSYLDYPSELVSQLYHRLSIHALRAETTRFSESNEYPVDATNIENLFSSALNSQSLLHSQSIAIQKVKTETKNNFSLQGLAIADTLRATIAAETNTMDDSIDLDATLRMHTIETDSLEESHAYPLGDLNAVIEDISKRHHLQLDLIRARLVQRWLLCDFDPSLFGDESCHDKLRFPMGSIFALTEEEVKDKMEQDNELRVVYVLARGRTVEYGVTYLLNFAFNRKSQTITFRAKSRAIRAVFRISPPRVIERIFQGELSRLKHYWQHCLYMAELEEMRYPTSMKELMECNKEGLVRGLWRDHRHDPAVVKLVANLSIDFNLTDPKLWIGILKQMLSFRMFRFGLTGVYLHLI